jgi:hypothetical protein
MRTRAVAAAALLGVLALLAGCGDTRVGRSPDPAAGEPAWQRLPDPPFSARSGSVVAWTGSEVLVVGGDTGTPCPPNADCAQPAHYARDGARLDVGERSWHPIAAAPVDVPAYSSSALLAGHLYVLADDVLLAYDVAHDTWSRIPTPSGFAGGQLVASTDRLVVASGSDEHGVTPDRVYEPGARRWTTLPDDPIGPAFDRVLTAIPTGLVLTAHELVDDPGAEKPSLVLAARWDAATGGWTRLRDSDQLGGWAWTWTGQRLVDPSLGGSDGGEVGNYGRTIPMGGVLDPVTGRWSRLPHPPKEGTGGWPVAALGGRFAAVAGWTYDDDTRSWAVVPRPKGAPGEPGVAVWADDRLVVVGGLDASRDGSTATRSGHAWISGPGDSLGRPRL